MDSFENLYCVDSFENLTVSSFEFLGKDMHCNFIIYSGNAIQCLHQSNFYPDGQFKK